MPDAVVLIEMDPAPEAIVHVPEEAAPPIVPDNGMVTGSQT